MRPYYRLAALVFLAGCGSSTTPTLSPATPSVSLATPSTRTPLPSGSAIPIPTVDSAQFQFSVLDGVRVPVPKTWLQNSVSPLLAESGKPATEWAPPGSTTGVTFEDVLVSSKRAYLTPSTYLGAESSASESSYPQDHEVSIALTLAKIGSALRISTDDSGPNHETSLVIDRGNTVLIIRLRQGSEGDDPSLIDHEISLLQPAA